MTDTVTTNYGWIMPGDHVNTNTWGALLNGDLQGIDTTVWNINAQVQPSHISLTGFPSVLTFTDSAGTHPEFTLGSDNNFVFYGTNATGALQPIWSSPMRATGAFNVEVPATFSQTITANTFYPSFGVAPNWCFFASSGSYIQQFTTGGWYDAWNSSTGQRVWQGAAGQLMTLDNAGDLGVMGAITSSGSISASSTISASSITTGSITTGSISASSTISASSITTGSISASSTINGNVISAANSPVFNLSGNASERWLNFATNWFWGWATSTGLLRWVSNNPSPAQVLSVDSQGNLIIAGAASKPGGGAWAATSDARIKTVTGDYTTGLDEVLQLRPVVYTYKGNDTPTADLDLLVPSEDGKEMVKATAHSGSAPYPASPHASAATNQKPFVGFIAQELEAVFPDMVTHREGFIDGQRVTDLRDIDVSSLVFALVNSVKALKAEIEVLKAK